MTMIAGCALSPYDLVERDAEMVSADVRRALDELIRNANKTAAKRDGKAYVDVQEFDRVIAFVPAPKPRAPGDPEEIPSVSYNVPKHAVLKKWTDRFALAQELSYRFSCGEILDVDRHLSPPYFTAKVKVLLKASHRWAYGGKPKDAPPAPEGCIVWKRSGMIGWGFSEQKTWLGSLPIPGVPDGKADTPSPVTDSIVQSALDSLLQTSPKENEHVVYADMAYDHLKKGWHVRSATTEKGFTHPKYLFWWHGVGDRGRYVLKPVDVRRDETGDEPATKE